MTRHVDIEIIDKMRIWIRTERSLRGWSTRRLAKEASLSAESKGISIKVNQQSISHFENGRIKSLPVWIEFVKIAFQENQPEASSPPPVGQKIEAKTNLECPDKLPKSIFSENMLYKVFLVLLSSIDNEAINPSLSSRQNLAHMMAKKFPNAASMIL